jgi:ribonuclease HI
VAAGVKIFFDGGYSPAGMEYALVAGGRTYMRRDLGAGSSMEAEWLALIAALTLADVLALDEAVLLGDAAAVIAQAHGAIRCPPAYRDHYEHFQSLPRPAGRLRIRYIKRTQNLAGIALEAVQQRSMSLPLVRSP